MSQAASKLSPATPLPRTAAICARIADIWRASPPPRAWVVALAFLTIGCFILMQTYEAGPEAGFQLAELSRRTAC
jgi:hypothetical protein